MTLAIAPISAVIPTRNRAAALARMLESLVRQEVLPAELIVVDASPDSRTQDVVTAFAADPAHGGCRAVWLKAERAGAATQRNQGVARATQPIVAFFDDDILFEPGCLQRLWRALEADAALGGVNAMITNQRYLPPGFVSRALFCILAGRRSQTYAGRVLGPAVNLLPEDAANLPDVTPCDWLNTTCTLYRREALPQPPFPDNFRGYSMMEDLALSLVVGRNRKLANVRTARVYHDSQPAEHKADAAALSRMELVNRHYIMSEIMNRRGIADYAKLALWELFQSGVSLVQQRGGPQFWRIMYGRMAGLGDILFAKPSRSGP